MTGCGWLSLAVLRLWYSGPDGYNKAEKDGGRRPGTRPGPRFAGITVWVELNAMALLADGGFGLLRVAGPSNNRAPAETTRHGALTVVYDKWEARGSGRCLWLCFNVVVDWSSDCDLWTGRGGLLLRRVTWGAPASSFVQDKRGSSSGATWGFPRQSYSTIGNEMKGPETQLHNLLFNFAKGGGLYLVDRRHRECRKKCCWKRSR
ncbi:hypothetical protein B0T17DRAFT_314387 [Bombardia bombarda]|uniref:Uncharacterized protein n=1 Tax=Bombardia bombarda TaxID=252184 RepID=A0AA40BY33_9PEZI|nr:hypothetical protein B0T17DRAFT_314387 [Bombardia bombarda]